MIIGNGMIASAFHSLYRDSKEVLIFASGVSDSSCEDFKQFDRESKLLLDSLGEYSKINHFIYFSTCSIYDHSLVSQSYVLHKLSMEEIVLSHSGGQIIRLPQVAGPQAPANTLLASLVRKILAKQEVVIWSNARRNIIDLNDVVRIVQYFIENQGFPSNIINIANSISYSVDDIVGSIEEVLKVSAKKKYVNKGSYYNINIAEIEKITAVLDVDFGCRYLKNVVARYYG